MVNQVGTFLGMRAVTPAMKQTGGGAIINVSSTVGVQAMPGLMAYVASKWAVRGMTRTAALELGHYGIRVICLCPGNIKTPMAGDELFEDANLEEFLATVPISRQQSPREVAQVAAFLASDAASYCTGMDFLADGGTVAGRLFPAVDKEQR